MTIDQAGRTDLHYAANEGRTADAEALLDSGANPALADRQGWTPLHFAAQSQHADVARVLLREGAAVDAGDVFGKTALGVAVFNVGDGEGEVIQVLLDAGADPDLKNHAGVSPRDLVERIANYDLSKHLPPQR